MNDNHALLFESLRAPLEAHGASLLELPDELAHMVDASGEARIDSVALAGEGVRFARMSSLVLPRYRGFNLCLFPETSRRAPVLGVDLAVDEKIGALIVDLWGLEHFDGEVDRWEELLAPLRRHDEVREHLQRMEGAAAELLSPHSVYARAPAGLMEVARGADLLVALVEGYLERLERAASVDEGIARRAQSAFCTMHAGKPSGRALLSGLFGEERGRRFIEEVFYPRPEEASTAASVGELGG